MNTQTRLSASRLIVMTLVCLMAVCLAACGGDDEEETTAEEILSIDTTPVTFTTGEKGTYYLYDYTIGEELVGAHVFTTKWSGDKIAVNLRRGRHKLLWITGIHNNIPIEHPSSVAQTLHGTHYYAEGDSIVWYDNELDFGFGVRYCEQDIYVTDHIPLTQPILFTRATSCVQIMSTDFSPLLDMADGDELFGVGSIVVSPFVKTMSLMGKDFKVINGGTSGNIFVKNIPESGYSCVTAVTRLFLCPKDGLQDVEVQCSVFDKGGNIIPTTTLPKISIKRGYTTHLEGPLFSGSTSDWKVLMYRLDR